jgi:hypothetical protein
MMAKSFSTSELLIEVIIVQVKHFHLKLFKKIGNFFCCPNQIIRHLPKHLLKAKFVIWEGSIYV